MISPHPCNIEQLAKLLFLRACHSSKGEQKKNLLLLVGMLESFIVKTLSVVTEFTSPCNCHKKQNWMLSTKGEGLCPKTTGTCWAPPTKLAAGFFGDQGSAFVSWDPTVFQLMFVAVVGRDCVMARNKKMNNRLCDMNRCGIKNDLVSSQKQSA